MICLELTTAQFAALQAMVSRGWSDGDLAEYLEEDQIPAYLEVLDSLGLDVRGSALPAEQKASRPQ